MDPADPLEPGPPPDASDGAPTAPGEGPDHSEEGRTLRRGFSFAMVSFVINGVVGIVGAVITSRLYGVDVVGQYALVIAPWVMLIKLSSLAERIALVRELAGVDPRSPRLTGLFVPVLGFSVTLTFVVAIPVLAVATAIFRGPADQPDLVLPALAVVIAYLLFDNTSANLDGVFSIFRAGRELFIGRFTQIASFPVFAVLLAPWERTIRALTVATIAGMVLSFLVRVVMVRAYLALRASGPAIRQGVRDLPELLRFSMKVVPGQIAAGFSEQAGTWVLGAVAPIGVVGAWSRSFQLAIRMNEAGYRVHEILYPTLVRRFREADMEGFGRALARMAHYTAVLLLLPASIAGGAAEGVLGIFGDGFEEAAGAFAVLLFVFTLAVVVMAYNDAVIAVGHPKQATYGSLLYTALAIGLLVPGALWAEAIGAAAALAVANVAQLTLLGFYLTHYVGRHCFPRPRLVAGMLLAATGGFVVARVVDMALPLVVGVAAAMVAGGITYGVLALSFAVEPDERRQILERVRGVLSRGRDTAEPA